MIVWFSEHQEEWYGLIYIVNPNSCVWVFTEYSVGSHLSGWHSWASVFYNQILHTWWTKERESERGDIKGRICTLKGWPCTLKSAHIPAGHKVHIYKEYHSVCPFFGIVILLTPLSPAIVPLPLEPKGGGGHTRLRVRGWGSPNSDRLEKSLAVCLLCAAGK